MAAASHRESFQTMDGSFVEEPTQHLCPDCGDVYKYRQGLQKHCLRKHGDPSDFKYRCGTCEATFVEKHQLTAHMVKHGGASFACDQCNQEYTTRSALNRHKAHGHAIKESVPCDVCKEVFSRKDALRDHMTGKHRQLFRYVCKEPRCGAKYRWRTSLACHEQKKHGQ